MINDIIDAINTSISDCLNLQESIYYGITKTVEVEGDKFPLTAFQNKGVKICPNDFYDLQVFHKVIDADVEADETFSFGKNTTYSVNYNVKTIALLRNSISDSNPTFNPESIALIIPQKVVNTDYKLITTKLKSINLDHDSIVKREWGTKIDYSKHKCKFFVFEIEYNIRALTCKLSCTSFLLLEELDRLLYEDASAIIL
jgi:hypothetical protein